MSEQQKTAGYKVVPVEPTDEMVWKAEEDSPPFYHGDPWYGSEPPSEGQINAIYKAMLEAAPPAPEPDPELARDAARYRWLLNQAWFQQAADRFDFTDGGMQIRFEKCMDEFIDAAMSGKGGA